MTVNIVVVLIAAVVQFIVSALSYSPLVFGKWWSQIMETSNLSKEELAKSEKEMIPFYALQFFLTFFFTFALANHMSLLPLISPFEIAFWVWLGYIVPIQIATIIWGKTKKRFWLKQAIVMTSSQFVCLMIAAFILSSF